MVRWKLDGATRRLYVTASVETFMQLAYHFYLLTYLACKSYMKITTKLHVDGAFTPPDGLQQCSPS